MSKEAMKLALEGAANYIDALGGDSRKYRQALANEALDKMAENARELGLDYEPAQQKPVAWWIPKAKQFCLPSSDGTRPFAKAWEPLYTSPQPAQRKPLTDEAIATVYWGATGQSLRPQDNVLAHNFARGIEAAHGIKGGAHEDRN